MQLFLDRKTRKLVSCSPGIDAVVFPFYKDSVITRQQLIDRWEFSKSSVTIVDPGTLENNNSDWPPDHETSSELGSKCLDARVSLMMKKLKVVDEACGLMKP